MGEVEGGGGVGEMEGGGGVSGGGGGGKKVEGSGGVGEVEGGVTWLLKSFRGRRKGKRKGAPS